MTGLIFVKAERRVKKALEFLKQNSIGIEETLDARKNRIEVAQAWDRVKNAGSIRVGKGKKVVTFAQGTEDQEAVLKQIMGPSGNLRAPTLQLGDDFIVGFHAEMYAEYFEP